MTVCRVRPSDESPEALPEPASDVYAGGRLADVLSGARLPPGGPLDGHDDSE